MKSAEQKDLDELVERARTLVKTMTKAELQDMIDRQTKALDTPRKYTLQDHSVLKDNGCKIEWYKPMTVGDLMANLSTFDPTARVIGPALTPYVRTIRQANGDILIVEMTDTKTKADCISKFTNEMNFRGFPPYADGGKFERSAPVLNLRIDVPDVEALKSKVQENKRIEIEVYLDNGNVFRYTVPTVTKAREHAMAIVQTGYRHSAATEPGILEHYPPHRISKVKIAGPGITTNYTDHARGT